MRIPRDQGRVCKASYNPGLRVTPPLPAIKFLVTHSRPQLVREGPHVVCTEGVKTTRALFRDRLPHEIHEEP